MALESAGWDESASARRLHTSAGEFLAERLIAGTGNLAEPRLPDIPGLETFAGAVVHTSRWDHELEFAGRRIGVIGTGSSGIQVIPELAKGRQPSRLYQRTPAWVLPHPNRRTLRAERAAFRRFPIIQRSINPALNAGLMEPNLFTLLGPNTGLGAGSQVTVIEAQLDYTMHCLGAMDCKRLETIEVREDVMDAFNAELQRRIGRTVWLSGGCSSWYLGADGSNIAIWPDLMPAARGDPGQTRPEIEVQVRAPDQRRSVWSSSIRRSISRTFIGTAATVVASSDKPRDTRSEQAALSSSPRPANYLRHPGTDAHGRGERAPIETI